MKLLTLSEVAEALGCSVTTVKRRIAVGALPAFRDGNMVRVRDVDLRRYVAERVSRRVVVASTKNRGLLLAPGERLTEAGR